jgi:hypothetical protein
MPAHSAPRGVAVLFFAGLEVAQQVASIGPVRVVLFTLRFAVAMVLLAARIWEAVARPADQPQPEPTTVSVSSVETFTPWPERTLRGFWATIPEG